MWCPWLCAFPQHWSIAPGNDITLPLLVPSGPGGRPRQQPLPTTGRNLNKSIYRMCSDSARCYANTNLCSMLTVFTSVSLSSTAGWWGLHSSTQVAGGSWACAGQEERAGLRERRPAQWWLSTLTVFSLTYTVFIQHIDVLLVIILLKTVF